MSEALVWIHRGGERFQVPESDPRAEEFNAQREEVQQQIATQPPSDPLEAARAMFFALPLDVQAYYQDDTNRVLIALQQGNKALAAYNLGHITPRNEAEGQAFINIVEALGFNE